MDLEGLLLSEIKSEKDKYYMILLRYVESKKYSKLVNITKKKQTHRYREQTGSNQWQSGGPI